MPGPADTEHARAAGKAVTWLNLYELRTPGVQTLDGASVILGPQGEPQPDAVLRIRSEFGGRTSLDQGYLQGAPELVIEIARATRYIDLGPKRLDYARAGVGEYIVRAMEPDELIWHVGEAGALQPIPADPDGIYRSKQFPGLWLDPGALLANDLAGLIVTLERGLATPEHAEFVARLAAAQKPQRVELS